VVELTVSVTVQEPLPAIVAPDRLRLPPLKLAVPLVQVVAGPDPLRFAGSAEAATARPVSWVDAFGLVMVSVSVAVPPAVIIVVLNAAAIVGALGAVTTSVAEVPALPAEAPVALGVPAGMV
jgi:hypothetical protein